MNNVAEISKSIRTAFANLLDVLPTVEFKPEWANGTGYFDHAVTDATITQPSVAQDEKGRRMIIVPMVGELATSVGLEAVLRRRQYSTPRNMVFFERYSNRPDFLVGHAPSAVLDSSRVNADDDLLNFMDVGMLQDPAVVKLLESLHVATA